MFKLKSMTNFASKREEFINAVKNGADQEAQGDAYLNMINALAEDVMDEAKKEVNLQVDQATNINKAKMSKETYQFFNEINTDVGYKEEKLLPETTIDEIFEDLTTEHPLLDAIGLKSAGIRLKFLRSETTGTAVWGKVFDEIISAITNVKTDTEDVQNSIHQIFNNIEQLVSEIENTNEISQASNDRSQGIATASEEQSASMLEVAEASNELSNLAVNLREKIQQYKY